jgi:hypothetical protein
MKAILLLFLLFITCTNTDKQVYIAKIISASGNTYKLTTQNSPRKVYLGTFIKSGTTLKTEDNSRCTVQINDSVLIKLDANTVFTFTDILSINNLGGNSTRLNLIKGKSFFKISKLLKDNDSFQVRTPTAIAGVRGTEFLLDTSHRGKDLLAVSKGKVFIRPKIDAVDNGTNNLDETVSKLLINNIEKTGQTVASGAQCTIDHETVKKDNIRIHKIIQKENKKIIALRKEYIKQKTRNASHIKKKLTASFKTIIQSYDTTEKSKLSALSPEHKIQLSNWNKTVPVKNEELHELKEDKSNIDDTPAKELNKASKKTAKNQTKKAQVSKSKAVSKQKPEPDTPVYTKQPNYIIDLENGTAFGLKIHMSLDEVYRLYGKENVIKFTPKFEKNNGKDTFFYKINDFNIKIQKNKVTHISVRKKSSHKGVHTATEKNMEKYLTKRGIGFESTINEVKQKYPEARIYMPKEQWVSFELAEYVLTVYAWKGEKISGIHLRSTSWK